MNACLESPEVQCRATSLADPSHSSPSLENHFIHSWGSCLIFLPPAPTTRAYALPGNVEGHLQEAPSQGEAGGGGGAGGVGCSPSRA